MPRLTRRVPSYRHHKASGQAVVKIDGREIYLGEFDSKASRDKYDQLVGQLIARRTLALKGTLDRNELSKSVRVADLVVAFWKEKRSYYMKDGKPTSEHCSFRMVIKSMTVPFRDLPADEFGPLMLKGIREQWVERGYVRSSINRSQRRLVAIFKWGVENELVHPETWQRLKAVATLKKNRTPAPESVPVMPVELALVEATIPHLSPVVADMVRFQVLTGARPGEVCSIRPCDVANTGDVWVYTPASHKTQHHGRSRKVFIGPEAQSVIGKYLDRDADVACFSPGESMQWFRDQRTDARVTPAKYGNGVGRKRDVRQGPGTRKPRDRFDTQSYGNAIKRGCRKAWPAPDEIVGDADAVKQWDREHAWAPNRLRHTRATEIRSTYGLEAAQVILGHATADITQIYAERDEELAKRVAAETG
ncbi:MAG: site-specific integrase [Planctomycetota bacterium]